MDVRKVNKPKELINRRSPLLNYSARVCSVRKARAEKKKNGKVSVGSEVIGSDNYNDELFPDTSQVWKRGQESTFTVFKNCLYVWTLTIEVPQQTRFCSPIKRCQTYLSWFSQEFIHMWLLVNVNSTSDEKINPREEEEKKSVKSEEIQMLSLTGNKSTRRR